MSRVVPPQAVSAAGEALAACGARIRERRWCDGTSGNFSAVVGREPLTLLITPSGADKGKLRGPDLLLVGADGAPMDGRALRPSAECALHVALAERAGASAVLHTHSIWGTLLGERFVDAREFRLTGYEMLKGIEGVRSHEQEIVVPVVPNSQDMAVIGAELERRIADDPALRGFLIAGHGLYTWGRDLDEAFRHVEIFEFLFELVGRRLPLRAFHRNRGRRAAAPRPGRTMMAVVTVTGTEKVLTAPEEISGFLEEFGIWFRRWPKIAAIAEDAGAEDVLAAFDEPIRQMKEEGGYTTADVIDVQPDTPNLQQMLDKFRKEHWHDEDEVRFVVAGRGVFHIHPRQGPVFRIEVRAGDMINVPRGTWHWFDLCDDSRIRCIRLFQDPSGWAPHYTDSGEDGKHQPLCFGPSYLPPGIGGG